MQAQSFGRIHLESALISLFEINCARREMHESLYTYDILVSLFIFSVVIAVISMHSSEARIQSIIIFISIFLNSVWTEYLGLAETDMINVINIVWDTLEVG